MHELGALTCHWIVYKALPSEVLGLERIFKIFISFELSCLSVRDVKLLESDMIALDFSPNKVNDQFESLGQELYPDHAQVAEEGPSPIFIILVNVDAGETVSHFSPFFVVRYYLHVVSLVTTFHYLQEVVRLVAGAPQPRQQLLVVVGVKVRELLCANFKRL